MSISESLAAAIRQVEPKLTELVSNERPEDDRKSIRVAAFAGLTTAAVALLNTVGEQSAAARTEIDALVQQLPRFVGQETVRIEHVILDPELSGRAKSQIQGAKMTNASTALALAYNLCGQQDMKRMLSLDKGPLGSLGGIAAVLSQRLVGNERAANIMMETVEVVNSLAASIAQAAARGAPKQGVGCAVASMGLLLGGASLAAGAVALVHYLV